MLKTEKNLQSELGRLPQFDEFERRSGFKASDASFHLFPRLTESEDAAWAQRSNKKTRSR